MTKITHKAPFSLRNQNSFFGSWPVLKDDDGEYSIVISFPVEGWQESAAVVITQKNEELSTEVYGAKDKEQALKQAIAALSLDVDDEGWEAIGKHDKVIADLQEKYEYLRPVLFHSPYEAAAGFVIGQRISVKQRQAVQKKMSEQLGDKIQVEGQEFAAFPLPQKLLELSEFPGLSEAKVQRLHGVAEAALDGLLNRQNLLDMKPEVAIEHLLKINGIGPFYASGILYRGAGIVDDITDDRLTKYALQQVYSLDHEPNQKEVLEIAEKWKPYSMWAEVLIHIYMHREIGMPKMSKR